VQHINHSKPIFLIYLFIIRIATTTVAAGFSNEGVPPATSGIEIPAAAEATAEGAPIATSSPKITAGQPRDRSTDAAVAAGGSTQSPQGK
jgi:hypothetical protein